MPWKSKAQQRWGHSSQGQKALGGKAKVNEWDGATNFGSLPESKSANQFAQDNQHAEGKKGKRARMAIAYKK